MGNADSHDSVVDLLEGGKMIRMAISFLFIGIAIGLLLSLLIWRGRK